MTTTITYTDIQPWAPSLEDDGLYDASSKPTATEVNTAITDVDGLLEDISPDSPQATRDRVIKLIMIETLNNLNNYKRAQGKNTIEAGEPTLKVTIDELKPIHLEMLTGSRGKTSPRLNVMDWR